MSAFKPLFTAPKWSSNKLYSDYIKAHKELKDEIELDEENELRAFVLDVLPPPRQNKDNTVKQFERTITRSFKEHLKLEIDDKGETQTNFTIHLKGKDQNGSNLSQTRYSVNAYFTNSLISHIEVSFLSGEAHDDYTDIITDALYLAEDTMHSTTFQKGWASLCKHREKGIVECGRGIFSLTPQANTLVYDYINTALKCGFRKSDLMICQADIDSAHTTEALCEKVADLIEEKRDEILNKVSKKGALASRLDDVNQLLDLVDMIEQHMKSMPDIQEIRQNAKSLFEETQEEIKKLDDKVKAKSKKKKTAADSDNDIDFDFLYNVAQLFQDTDCIPDLQLESFKDEPDFEQLKLGIQFNIIQFTERGMESTENTLTFISQYEESKK